MTDFVRRIVSGNKTRFKDDKLNIELGLSLARTKKSLLM